MRREQRLRRGVDFERVRANRKSWAHPLIVCYERERDDPGPTRVGIVVGRRVGKAATRNRVKRRIREAARSIYPQLDSGYDLIVIARQPAAEASLAQLTDALLSVLPRMNSGRRLRKAAVATPLSYRAPDRKDVG